MKKFLNFKFVLSVISSLVFTTTAVFSILSCDKTFAMQKSDKYSKIAQNKVDKNNKGDKNTYIKIGSVGLKKDELDKLKKQAWETATGKYFEVSQKNGCYNITVTEGPFDGSLSFWENGKDFLNTQNGDGSFVIDKLKLDPIKKEKYEKARNSTKMVQIGSIQIQEGYLNFLKEKALEAARGDFFIASGKDHDEILVSEGSVAGSLYFFEKGASTYPLNIYYSDGSFKYDVINWFSSFEDVDDEDGMSSNLL